MKKFLFFATAVVGMMFTGCSSDDFIAETPPVNPTEDTPILFNSTRGVLTRANDITGAAAAELLGNKFVVSGYKGSSTATVGSIVFDNYLVEYAANTAYTTESNTRNWEYVGKGLIPHAETNGITRQTIKYWDYSQAQYDFIAWSTGTKEAIYAGTPEAGQVLVSAITPATATGANGVAYTMTGAADDLTGCYVADIVTWDKSKYGAEAVPIRFRSLGTKVRIGIYETVPGYSVRNVRFYTKAGQLSNVTTEITDNATIFTIAENEIYQKGTYTIFFPTVDATSDDNNVAHIKFTPDGTATQSTVVEWGALNYTTAEDAEKTTGNVFLGRSSNGASFAGNPDNNYYVNYLPNETGTNLNLRVDFTLESTDGSGEIIEVKSASAQVPLIYAQWKPGYAYTYLFKITDNTNGRTGNYDPTLPDDDDYNSDPVGLYPITFDAVVVNSEEDNTQETITTVATPSITTYQKGSAVVDNDEYLAATGDIFVTVNEDNDIVELDDDNAALYTLSEDCTEAFVVDALSMQNDDGTNTNQITGRSGLVLTKADFDLVSSIEYGPDGNVITLTTGKAAQFTPAAGTYAFVYTQTAPTTTEDKYIPVSFSDNTVTTKYRYAYKAAGTGDVQKGVLYFETETSGKKTVFLGQNVGNLYTKDGDTYTKASGYSVSGTTYYYGVSYKQAHTVAFADFASTALYVTDGNNGYVRTADSAPQDGTAYYYKDGDDYIYCVIMPEQADNLLTIDTENYEVITETTAVDGMTYFDKFTKNDGIYFTKVIKVL